MASKQYVVVAPLATITLEDGTVHYLNRGAVLPSSATKEQIAHLVKVGVVEKVEVLTVDDIESAAASTDGGTPAEDEVEIPDGDPTIDWSAKQLTAWAEREKVELPKSAKSKPDILDAIAAAKQS